MAPNGLTVVIARKIITMNRSWPYATAIATQNGRIVEVGTLETLKPWLESHAYRVNDQFADKVITPGFIDRHPKSSFGDYENAPPNIHPTNLSLPGVTINFGTAQ